MLKNPINTSTRLFFVCLILAALWLVPTLQAQEIEEPSVDTSSETTNTLRERIEKIVEQQKENVEAILGEFPNQLRGFVGQVVRVSETTLTLENRGATRIVPLDENVILVRGSNEVAADTIEIDDWALVLGRMEEGTFVPKKITFTQNSLLPDPHVVHLGSIKEIKVRALDLQSRSQEEIITVDLTTNTEYQDSEGGAAQLADFVEDDQVLLIGYQDDGDIIVTTVRALAPFTQGE
jgi:transcriptional regulator of heat shock response